MQVIYVSVERRLVEEFLHTQNVTRSVSVITDSIALTLETLKLSNLHENIKILYIYVYYNLKETTVYEQFSKFKMMYYVHIRMWKR